MRDNCAWFRERGLQHYFINSPTKERGEKREKIDTMSVWHLHIACIHLDIIIKSVHHLHVPAHPDGCSNADPAQYDEAGVILVQSGHFPESRPNKDGGARRKARSLKLYLFGFNLGHPFIQAVQFLLYAAFLVSADALYIFSSHAAETLPGYWPRQ